MVVRTTRAGVARTMNDAIDHETPTVVTAARANPASTRVLELRTAPVAGAGSLRSVNADISSMTNSAAAMCG